MKRRARQVTIGAAVLGTVLPAILIAVCGVSVRDHVQAWHFQLTRDTKAIEPLPERAIRPRTQEDLLVFAADRLRLPVIVDPLEVTSFVVGSPVPESDIRGSLERQGWRVLEQRFPRRAYVLLRSGMSYQTMEWDPTMEWQSSSGRPFQSSSRGIRATAGAGALPQPAPAAR